MRVIKCAICAIFLLIIGCGGGSSGTGGQFFEGRLIDQNSRALSGISVTIANTEYSSVTNSTGNFSIEAETISGDIELDLSGNNINTSTIIPDVPATSTRVTVVIKVNVPKNTASLQSLNIEEPRSSSSSRSSSRRSSSSSGGQFSSTSSSDDDNESSSSAQSSDDDSSESESHSSSSQHSEHSSEGNSSSSQNSSSSSSDDDDNGGG